MGLGKLFLYQLKFDQPFQNDKLYYQIKIILHTQIKIKNKITC